MAEGELQQIGPYTVTKLLRTSSTGSYYLGAQPRKKQVLIKRLHVPLVTAESREIFRARVKQLRALKHRSIIEVKEGGFDGEHGYLVMEYMPGETARQQMAAIPQLSCDEVRRRLSLIAPALHYAHVKRVLHNHLHPGNLIINDRNEVLLTEFSLHYPGLPPELDEDAFAVPYMAPEQLQGHPTAASDQYALAVIVYEWLCGRRPYDATEPELLSQQQEQAPLPPLQSYNKDISPELERVVLRALAYTQSERFPSVQEFADRYLSAMIGFPLRKSTSASPAASMQVASPVRTSESAQGASLPPRATLEKAAPSASLTVSRSLPASKQQRQSSLVSGMITTPAAPTREEAPIPPRPGAAHLAPQEVSYEATRSTPAQPAKEQRPSLGYDDTHLLDTVAADLANGGMLSKSLPGYEERLPQMEMAQVVTQSLKEQRPAIIEAGTGTGKALDVDTPIPTATGWKRMGDLAAGDMVFDECGNPTRVTRAFDIMYDRPCYEVEFSDGSSLVADAEHEWVSYTCADRKWAKLSQTEIYKAKKFVTADTLHQLDQLIHLSKDEDTLSVEAAKALLGGHHWSIFQAAHAISPVCATTRPTLYSRRALLTGVKERLVKDLKEQRRDGRSYTIVTTKQLAKTLTIGSSQRANHAIPVAGPLTLPDRELPITPYFLGFWLGDGSSWSNQIKTADPEIIQEIEVDGYTVRPLVSQPSLYAVDDENGKGKNRWQPGMTGRLRALNLLHNKHIPPIYLRASAQQRRALLAGLLDTDGTVNRDGAIEFTTTTPRLAEDVYELICSLGFRPARRCGRAKLNGKDCGPKWTIAFTTEQQVFRLPRKVQAHKERLRNYSPDRNRFRYVVAVREVPTRPVRCIQVEAESHLYLAGRSLIPTHNSLAYLVPIVRSGRVAIVSTANKALQEQLFYKDIPFVQKHIKDFEAALVKGVSNYVCIDRLESERVGMQFYAKNREFQHLVDLVNDPESNFMGDFETLGFQLSPEIRSRVATDSDQCAWSKCSYFGECYVRQMREQAALAQVIVVNHTLLLLDAAIGGFLLPERDVIVLDEAHHLEEEATRAFTITINPSQVTLLLAQRMLKDHSQLLLQDETNRAAQSLWLRLTQLAEFGYKTRVNLESPVEEGLRLATVIADLADSLRKQRPKDMPEREGQIYDKLLKRTQNLSENVRTVFSVAQREKFVYYIERVEAPGQRLQLQASAAPLDVTDWLKAKLFDKCNVICTSATLATIGPNPTHPEDKGPNFAYFRRRVGLDPEERSDVLERILPLAFDYENNALLYLPRDLPEPAYKGDGADDYARAIAREMYRLVKLSRGRAFLLFSSKRMLDRAYELMAPHLPYPLLKQGDMTRIELTRRFREEEGSVLFGLKSFWEGVDIAGDALSLVVIDKLPFDPPDDPVHEARVALMKAAGENWFGTYVLPQAVLRLKQGLGRLLRSREDRGVMAILDARLHTKGYGKLILNALPPARRTTSIKEVERFFSPG